MSWKRLYIITLCLGATFSVRGQIQHAQLDFEGHNPDIFLYNDFDSTNVWIVGNPIFKSIYDSAVSDSNVIYTSANQFYSPNDTSYFVVGTTITEGLNGTYYEMGGLFLSDTDSLNDFGTIEVSFTKRSTWIDLINDTSIQSNGLIRWEDLTPPELSGTHENWTGFSVSLNNLRPNPLPDTVWFRFGFISDSNAVNNGGGLFFDNIGVSSIAFTSVSTESRQSGSALRLGRSLDESKFQLLTPTTSFTEWSLISTAGVELSTGRIESSGITKIPSPHATGLYFVKVISDTETEVLSFIKY